MTPQLSLSGLSGDEWKVGSGKKSVNGLVANRVSIHFFNRQVVDSTHQPNFNNHLRDNLEHPTFHDRTFLPSSVAGNLLANPAASYRFAVEPLPFLTAARSRKVVLCRPPLWCEVLLRGPRDSLS